MARVVRFLIVFVTATGIGVCVGVGLALLGHELLVWRYGSDLSVIDNAPPMLVAVALSYLGGAAVGLASLALGWRWFVRKA
jgi:hypothetical protein